MWILVLFLAFCWWVGGKTKKEATFRQIERDIFISDVISGKRKL